MKNRDFEGYVHNIHPEWEEFFMDTERSNVTIRTNGITLDGLFNGDMIRIEFPSGTAMEGRFMRTPLEIDTTSERVPYLWFEEGVRVYDLPPVNVAALSSLTVLKRWGSDED